MFAGKKSAQIREILISESAWEEMTCLFAPSLAFFYVLLVVTLFCDMNNIPLKGLMQEGMLIKLSAYALQANVLWLGVKVSMNSDEFF
nr:hypothetical protein [Klebsiella quasipneumoniae]